MLNRATIIGNVATSLPQLRSTATNDAVMSFRVAVNENWTDREGKRQEHTEWFNVVCFRHLAENCSKHLTKGRQVYVEARLRTREFEGHDKVKRNVTEIFASRVVFLGPRAKDEPSAADDGSAE